jgi:hypothetical protein
LTWRTVHVFSLEGVLSAAFNKADAISRRVIRVSRSRAALANFRQCSAYSTPRLRFGYGASRKASRKRRASSLSSASSAIFSQSLCWCLDSARSASVRAASSACLPHSSDFFRNHELGIGEYCSTQGLESEQKRTVSRQPAVNIYYPYRSSGRGVGSCLNSPTAHQPLLLDRTPRPQLTEPALRDDAPSLRVLQNMPLSQRSPA